MQTVGPFLPDATCLCFSEMVTAGCTEFVEREIDYAFDNKSILVTALTAAHRDEHTSPEGNRRLARVGENIINLIVDDAWEAGDSTRGG